MSLTDKQKTEKNNCIKELRRSQKFELISRLLCYACILPFFHTATCIGQRKVPVVSAVGATGFVLAAGNVVRLKNKQDKLIDKLNSFQKETEKRC